MNEIDGKPPVTTFDDYGENIPTFETNVTLNGTYFDGVEFDRASMTIRRIGTSQYFNGQDFQEQRFELPAELISDQKWQLDVSLPSGFLRSRNQGI